MKRGLLLLCICIFFLTGCVYDKVDVVEIPNEHGEASVKSVTRQYDSWANNIALYENKLLYSRQLYGTESYYVLDFQTGTIEVLGERDDVGAIRGSALADDTLYFYTDEDVGYNTWKNVLYGCDLSTNELLRISENKYEKYKIPLIGFENKLYALQGNQRSDVFRDKGQRTAKVETFISMEYDHYLQMIDEYGNAAEISLLQDDIGIPNIKNASEGQHQVLCIDSDAENIIALEGMDDAGITKYYVTKYTADYNCVFAQDISSIFDDYAITKTISAFRAFGDYFMLSDLYGTSILCRCKENEIEVIFCESNIEYAKNYCKNGEFEHFYIPETNDIYRLDLRTGVLESRDYDLDNEKYVIRSMLAYDDTLMISKYTGEGDHVEVLYLISQEYEK